MNHQKHLNFAFLIAQTVPKVANASMAAIVVHKNSVISVGTNSPKTHPFVTQFQHREWHQKLHAESAAILKAIKSISSRKLRKCTLYVARAKKNNEHEFVWGMARPCQNCANLLEVFPVKDVIYTLDDGGFGSFFS
jgi:deoxycytidylate deaminase